MPKPPIQLKRSGTATATPAALEHGELALNYADGKVFWKNASNTISSFTFQSYALASHTHAASDVTSGTLDAARLPLATTGAAGAIIVGTGLGVSSGTVSVTYGTTAGTSCQGNDSRLSDTRTPTDGSVTSAKIADANVSFAKLQSATGVSVIGRSANSAGVYAEIVAGTNGHVLRRSGDTVGFGTIATAGIDDSAVTYAKMQNVSATDRLLGRSSSGAGVVEEITCTAFGRSLIDDADAAAGRTTLGAAPTASPTFTGTLTAAQARVNGSDGVTVLLVNGGTKGVRFNISSASSAIEGVDAATGVSSYQPLVVGGSTLTLATAGASAITIDGSQKSTLSGQLLVTAGSASAPGVAISGDPDTGIAQLSAAGANTLSICTNSEERVRFGASGHLFLAQSALNPAVDNIAGVTLGPSGYVAASRSGLASLFCNRITDDGTLVDLRQDGTSEGTISVSGNTISYNAFCGSHWAQLIDNSRPAILRGTVLETIDEMCEWPGEPENHRLPRVKISDTPASRRVYGVFMAWDEDDAATGDMYATALGAYMVRVSGVVQSGDLLESAGDGTARTQPDDIVRSSTIGKVSSTHRVAEYDDGSYLVPCVLMCG